MSETDIPVITSQEALNAFCEKLSKQDVVFVDTEFHRESTYWPKLCLIQASAEGVEGIIDPLAGGIDLAPFLKILGDPDIGKVFHAARQDMEIFTELMGTPPAPVFDTQIAAMALGLGDSISYENLISQLTGGQIDKSSQFTDWARRPLTQKQLKYALGDVTHLRAAYAKMADQLDSKNRWSWIEDDNLALSELSLYKTDPEDAWKRMKMRRHRKDYLAVLKNVAIWRETLAQELNRPRSRILKDDAVQEIADQRPTNPQALDRLRSVPKGFGNSRHGDGLMKAINDALANVDEIAPVVEKPKHRGQSPAGASDLLRVLLKQICDDAGVTPRLVANSADLERVASGDGEETAVMSGWRYELFGRHAQNLLHGRMAITFKDGQIEMFNTSDLPASDGPQG
ncbi:MAG: ribonuclease D [Ponticaulis sp.]|nr:ribonuclease D [Ponticaulis sp.]